MNKSDAQINAKVRLINDRTLCGTIVAASSNKVKEHVIVEWQNGECEPVHPNLIELSPVRDNKLEQEFETLTLSVCKKIQNKVKRAEKLIKEACQLSDDNGIPFFTEVSLLGQPYVPETFKTRWSCLDSNFVADLTEVMVSDLSSPYGWQTSEIC
jgi:hypothetical protein